MTRLTIVALMIYACVGCKQSGQNDTQMNDMTANPIDSLHFGDVIDTIGMQSYATIIDQISQTDTLDTKIYGQVKAVCQVKGCWMTIVNPQDTAGTELMVKFKDYGFFMPLDLAGKNVVMQGKAYQEVTSVEDLKHYAEDEGLSQEEIAAITEPKNELKFMASGVMILK